MRGEKWSHTEDTEYTEPCGAEAYATLALPSGWQAQTKCVRFCESLRSLRETNYQSIEFSPLKQEFVI